MRILYLGNVAIHVLAAMFWLGGMFFLAVVGAPALRTVEPAAFRQRLFQQLGIRFRRAGWWSIGVLVITGVINLHFRGWLRWEGVLGLSSFWSSAAGHALALKLLAVVAMLVVSALHDFVLGPRAGRAPPGSPLAITLRSRASLLARLNALLAILLVVSAVWLARA